MLMVKGCFPNGLAANYRYWSVLLIVLGLLAPVLTLQYWSVFVHCFCRGVGLPRETYMAILIKPMVSDH